MVRSHNLNFSQQNLRNRSFANQDLSGANFQQADLRGCSFRRTYLMNANFDGAIVGPSSLQYLLRFMVILSVAVVVKEVYANLIFGGLGKTWEDSVWPLLLLLCCFFAAIGALATLATRPLYRGRNPLMGWGLWGIAGLLNGALVGFYFGGTFSDNSPTKAAMGAVIGGLLVLVTLFVSPIQTLVRLAIITASAIATYGFAFYIGNWAIAALSTEKWLWGIILGCITVLYLGLFTHQVIQGLWLLRNSPGTFFRGADLTQTSFKNVKLHLTDRKGKF
jgi:Pentapeptide repeats (8 copies)